LSSSTQLQSFQQIFSMLPVVTLLVGIMPITPGTGVIFKGFLYSKLTTAHCGHTLPELVCLNSLFRPAAEHKVTNVISGQAPITQSIPKFLYWCICAAHNTPISFTDLLLCNAYHD
jgi:hypothetical protein